MKSQHQWKASLSMLSLFLLLNGFVMAAHPPAPQDYLPVEKLVLEGGTLIDGTGGPPLENSTVIIAGDRIEKVLSGVGHVHDPGTRVIQIQGKFLLPGLIDGHVHYLGWAAPLYLAHGVTSVLDLGNYTTWILAQKSAVAEGLLPGPRIFTAGGQLDSPPGTFPHAVLVSTEEEARQVVREHVRAGVDYIKAYTMLGPDLLKATIDEARSAGLVVRGHITVGAREAARFGIASLEHMSGIAIAAIDDPEKLQEIKDSRTEPDYVMETVRELAPLMKTELFEDLIQLLIEHGTAISPTLVSWWMGVHPHTTQYEEQDRTLLQDPLLSFIPGVSRESILGRYARARDGRSDPKFQVGYAKMQRFIKEFFDAGGTVVAASDTTLGAMPGMDFHRELELLVDAGLSPHQALQAATRVPAQIIGKGRDLGTVEPGKWADLIVVGGDPLADIRNTRKIELVIKGGEVLDTDYDPQFSDLIPRPLSAEYLRRFSEGEEAGP
jgi:imidazolonepropionase-like amidohydrolase